MRVANSPLPAPGIPDGRTADAVSDVGKLQWIDELHVASLSKAWETRFPTSLSYKRKNFVAL